MESRGNIFRQIFGKSTILPDTNSVPVDRTGGRDKGARDLLNKVDDRPSFSKHLRDEAPLEKQPIDSAPVRAKQKLEEPASVSVPKVREVPKKLDRSDKSEDRAVSSGLMVEPEGGEPSPEVNKPSDSSIPNTAPKEGDLVDPSLVVTKVDAVTPSTGSQPAKPQAHIGAVVGGTEIGVEAPPLLLNKAQVDKLTNVLLQTGVVSPNPAEISNQEFAFIMAVDLLSLANVIVEVGNKLQNFLSNNPHLAQQGLIQLPNSAQDGLSLLISLQGVMDADSFAQLLGSLPGLTQLGIEEATSLWQSLNQSIADGQISPFGKELGSANEVIFIRLNFAQGAGSGQKTPVSAGAAGEGEPSTEGVVVPTYTGLDPEEFVENRPDGLITEPDNTAGMGGKAELPEWLHDARTPPPAVGYKPVVPSSARTDALTDTIGNDLQQKVDQQAVAYRLKQKQSLPEHMRHLADVPPRGEPEYLDWLQKVAVLVHDASRSQLPSTDGRAAYVFDDPDISNLLKMLPVTALRDVVRAAGKLGRLEIEPKTLQNSHDHTLKAREDSVEMTKRLDDPRGGLSSVGSDDVIDEVGADKSVSQSQRAGSSVVGKIASPALAQSRDAESGDNAAQRDIRQVIQHQKGAGTQYSSAGSGDDDERQAASDNKPDADAGLRQSTRSAEGDTARQPQFREVIDQQLAKPNQTQRHEQAERAKRAAQLAQIAKRMRAQITMQILKQVQQNTQKMELQLNPRRLGKMDIEITIEGSKTSLRFLVERAETLEALEKDIDQLIQALREAGISADKGAMEFSLKENNQQQAEAKKKKQEVSVPEEDEEDILALGEKAEADNDGRYDIRV